MNFDERVRKLLKPDESIITIIREYSIAKIWVYVIVAILYLALLFFMPLLFQLGKLGVGIFTAGLLGLVWYTIRSFIIWYLDVMIVTPRRLIDIQQTGMFTKTVQEVPWSTVQQVKYTQRGIMATVFNYGTVIIITTPHDTINLYHVFEPAQVRDMITNYAATYDTDV